MYGRPPDGVIGRDFIPVVPRPFGPRRFALLLPTSFIAVLFELPMYFAGFRSFFSLL